MNSAVRDVLQRLISMATEKSQPDEAQSQFLSLRESHPGLDMELVWEREPYDGSLHYDVLVRVPSGGTVSVSYSRDGGLPWPLRGVKRWSDANVVQVNGVMLTMEEAVALLDVLWNEAPLMQRVIDACLAREELNRHPVEVSDEELQLGMDGFRRRLKLFNSDETRLWMEARGLTHEQLERLVAGDLMCAKLRTRVAAGKVEPYFESHSDELAVAHIARITFASDVAGELVEQRSTTIGPDLARLAELGAEHVELCWVRRRDLPDPLQAEVFERSPGELIGPVRVEDRHEAILVFDRRNADLDVQTRALIEHILFAEWMAQRRRDAHVCWHWGSPVQARNAL